MVNSQMIRQPALTPLGRQTVHLTREGEEEMLPYPRGKVTLQWIFFLFYNFSRLC